MVKELIFQLKKIKQHFIQGTYKCDSWKNSILLKSLFVLPSRNIEKYYIAGLTSLLNGLNKQFVMVELIFKSLPNFWSKIKSDFLNLLNQVLKKQNRPKDINYISRKFAYSQQLNYHVKSWKNDYCV